MSVPLAVFLLGFIFLIKGNNIVVNPHYMQNGHPIPKDQGTKTEYTAQTNFAKSIRSWIQLFTVPAVSVKLKRPFNCIIIYSEPDKEYLSTTVMTCKGRAPPLNS